MEKNIIEVVGGLKLATFDEIKSILSVQLGSVKNSTLESHLQSLCKEGALLNILPEENSMQILGYTLGPNFDAERDIEFKKFVLNADVSVRSYDIINWRALYQRLLKNLTEEASNLKEDILKLYEPPKKLEMRYFDLSINYRSLCMFFYEKVGYEFVNPVSDLLNECKSCLNNLEF